MAKKYIFFILGLLWLTCSCTTTSVRQPSVCDNLTEPSYLCEVAEKHGVRLEDIGAALMLANTVAVSAGAYNTDDALKVLEHLQSILKNPVSYLFFRSQVTKQVFKYPGLFDVADQYLAEFGSAKIMRRFDRVTLQNWISKRIRDMEASRWSNKK